MFFMNKSAKKKRVLPKFKFEFKLSKRNKKFLILLLAILALLGLFYNFKNLFLASLVDSQPITRWALDRELEKQFGQQVLENLVSKALIEQEAKKQKIETTAAEIEKELEGIKEDLKNQNLDLEKFLELQKISQKDLEAQIKIQLLIEKMIGKDIKITDKEAEDYFEQNKSFFPEKAKFEEVKDDVIKSLKQQKMSQKFQSWLEGLRQKAKIYYFLKF